MIDRLRCRAAQVTLTVTAVLLLHRASTLAAELARTPMYGVAEVAFVGPMQSAQDVPARDVDFWVAFRHESGAPGYKVHGFWDGDGRGGSRGNVFRVRFCPTKSGRWTLAKVHSSARQLVGQKEGDYITAVDSNHPGFWIIDGDSPGGRWYKRSDGSHPYIFGNTHYSFLSGHGPGGKPTGNDIAVDIRANAAYFKKLRFSVHPDRYPHPSERPFLDDRGEATNDGDHSHRPNSAWFANRVDIAVKEAHRQDMIADLILCGPDIEDARATLRAGHNRGDPRPYLKYIAARYGSFPNVWICLCNEFDIKQPKYSAKEIARCGQILREYLPYSTPLSVHASPDSLWPAAFDALPPWNDHQIVQHKLKKLDVSADTIQAAWRGERPEGPRNKPTINDELSYEGVGDGHSELDTIESHLGAFLGGGYASTGSKPANKLGQYFVGNFNAAEHKSADNLRFLRRVIDDGITFWQMAPTHATTSADSTFTNLGDSSRVLARTGHEYAVGTNQAREGIVAELPAGSWKITRHDIIGQTSAHLAERASGLFTFDAPASRAVLFHFKNR